MSTGAHSDPAESPLGQGCLCFAHAGWPETVDQDLRAILRRRRFVDALDPDVETCAHGSLDGVKGVICASLIHGVSHFL